jgi:peptidylprolyl isomerase
LNLLLASLLVLASCGVLAAQESRPASAPGTGDTKTTTTASGLAYTVLKPGRPGPHPKMGDVVKVHYTGRLTDGKVFDSSEERGEPAQFALGMVIEGWNEGLQLMTQGARYRFTIPPDLAYGAAGRPPTIPASATLVFEVELLGFKSKPEFPKSKPEGEQTTASGLKYQVIEEGSGTPPTTKDGFELEFAFWNEGGKLLDWTGNNPQPFRATVDTLNLEFLKEAPLLMKPGARYRFEVPAKLAFKEREVGPDLPPNSPTIWLVTMVRTMDAPSFEQPVVEKMTKTKSGLLYEVLEEGKGPAPKLGDQITVDYTGWLEDGKIFDSSHLRGEPVEFPLGQKLEGWNEGLQLMKAGGRYRLVIPPELAYGAAGQPPVIGANAKLIFLIELKKVVPAAGK